MLEVVSKQDMVKGVQERWLIKLLDWNGTVWREVTKMIPGLRNDERFMYCRRCGGGTILLSLS